MADLVYTLWFYPQGGNREDVREKRGSFNTLDAAISASDYPNPDCWDQSASNSWQLDDPIIEAAGLQHSWWAIDREPTARPGVA